MEIKVNARQILLVRNHRQDFLQLSHTRRISLTDNNLRTLLGVTDDSVGDILQVFIIVY